MRGCEFCQNQHSESRSIFKGTQKFLPVLATLIVRPGSNPVHVMCMLLGISEICEDRRRKGRTFRIGVNINIFACTVNQYHTVKESNCDTKNIYHLVILSKRAAATGHTCRPSPLPASTGRGKFRRYKGTNAN